jgi:pilus assembly protein Flp/PilA
MRVGNTRRSSYMKTINLMRAFVRNEEGQDLIEYALLVALISLVAVVAIGTAGSAVNSIFGKIAAQLTTAL